MSLSIFATIERDGKEIEVEIDSEWQDDDPSVGMNRGLIVYPTAKGEGGVTYELTESEMDRISEEHTD